MKRKNRMNRKQRNPIYLSFLICFLLGVVIPNLMWRDIYAQGSLISTYVVECLGDLEEKQFLLNEVIQKRAGTALLASICGISIFGVPTSIFMIGILAFELGSILTSSILQFGVQGGLLGSALLFPHGFMYIAGMFGICTAAYTKSLETWNNQSIFSKQLYKYIGKIFLFLLFIAGGIALEVYISPEMIKIIIKNLEIFS